ncbi:DUF4349 domain-containing protein [Jatrophihabitans telluris]|uniref:DUF4349 domain-containing protein n=1 Tax=Jatrophihabitans telluris TaxID=2038343 RepID=A0ABY4R1B6_9ACTN|nr:DUF4349 domain-containing protein [Jatrophihabitans telluris]UQX89558.1 DUF4349 domain-containing protein [Jatrophihabitans telluris]
MLSVVIVAALAGCSGTHGKTSSSAAIGGGSSAGSYGMPAAAGAPMAAASNGQNDVARGTQSSTGKLATTPTEPLQQRDMVYTATLAVQVGDVDAAANKVSALAISLGGRVDGDDRSSTKAETPIATLVLRLPPDKLDRALAGSVGLGKELGRTLKGEDVTSAHADVSARVSALRTSVQRLHTFLAHSGSISDLVSLESQLTKRESELESTVAQQRALADSIALASLTVTLSKKASVPAAVVKRSHDPSGFGRAVGAGWHALVLSWRYLAAGLGYAGPFLLLTLALGLPALWLRRRLSGSVNPVSPVNPEDSAATP